MLGDIKKVRYIRKNKLIKGIIIIIKKILPTKKCQQRNALYLSPKQNFMPNDIKIFITKLLTETNKHDRDGKMIGPPMKYRYKICFKSKFFF